MARAVFCGDLHRFARRTSTTLALLLCTALVPAGAARAESLDRDLAELVQTHPLIQAAGKTSEASGEAVTTARAGYLPKLEVFGNVGPEYVDTPSRTSYDDPYYRGADTAGIKATQRLFDGFQTDASVDAAKQAKRGSDAKLRATRQEVLLEGASAYMDVLRQVHVVQLSRDNEKNIQEQLHLEDERVRRGAGMAVDVLQAKHRLQIAKERRVAAEGEFQNAVSRYTQVWGRPPEVGGMTEPQPLVKLIPASLDEAILIAGRENPNLESGGAAIAEAQERRRAAESGYYPDVDLVGRMAYEHNHDALTGTRRDWSLLLQANWELFSGFRTQSQVAQASLQHAASQDRYQNISRKTQEEVKIAWNSMQTARERLELLENAVNLAGEVWEARRKQREAGRIDVIDVLDAETDIYTARINYTAAFFDFRLAVYKLLKAMGRLEVDTVNQAKS